MKVCVVILVLYLLIIEQVLAIRSKSSTKTAKTSKSAKSAKCPKDLACDKLKAADCTVTEAEFRSEINGKDWLVVDAVAFPTLPDEGKVKQRWTQPHPGATVTRQTRLGISSSCQEPSIFKEFNITETECGIELKQGTEGPLIDAFCSQSLTEYLFAYVCVAGTGDTCTRGYIGLHVPDNRFECRDTYFPLCPNGPRSLSELDLTMLSWEKINQDRFKFICAFFPAAPYPKQIWNGQECPFT